MRTSAKALAFLLVAAASAGTVILWPRAPALVPTEPDVLPAPSPAAAPGTAAPPPPARAPEKEGFSTEAEAVALASRLPKIRFGIGVALRDAAPDEVLVWERVYRALLEAPGVYLRWGSEEERNEVLASSLGGLVPVHSPEGGDFVAPWGGLGAEVQQAGFGFRFENPVLWMGRKRER